MRVTSNSTHRARKLRKHMSLPEVMLWKHLRGREPGKPIFRRQHPIGPYVLDFYCSSARLAVEIDGGSHGFGDQPQRDARKDAYFRHLGNRVVRIPAGDVITNASGVAEWLLEIARATAAPPPPFGSPSPADAGEVFRRPTARLPAPPI